MNYISISHWGMFPVNEEPEEILGEEVSIAFDTMWYQLPCKPVYDEVV